MNGYSGTTASNYAKVVDIPIRRYCESWMFSKLWGDLSGQRVLDAACGTGFVTQLLLRANAREITGVDRSVDMLKIFGRQLHEQHQVELVCESIERYQSPRPFDLVTSAFLFNEAASVEDLQQMVQALADNLGNEGALCVEFDDIFVYLGKDLSQYNYVGLELLPSDNNTLRYKLSIDMDFDKPIDLFCYYHSQETIGQVLESAGFRNIQFHPIEVSQEGIKAMPEGFWDRYSETPPTCFVTASKC